MSNERGRLLQERAQDLSDVLAPMTDAITFAAGARIFDQRDDGEDAYLIESGYVEIARDDNGRRHVLAVLGPGEIFGEMAAMDGLSRSASATAVHETVLVSVTREQIEAALRSVDPLAQLLVRTALGRLRAANNAGMESDTHHDEQVQARGRMAATRADAARNLRFISEMRTALEREDFVLAFQPIVSFADGRVAGVEALLRWKHAERGMVSPVEFIPAAERTGLIVPLGEWVLQKSLALFALAQTRSPRRTALPEGQFISINVSPRQLESEPSVERLARIIERAQVDPTQVKLEITEQALHDPALAMAALSRLRSTGATIAIDDFGTGYSSLTHLCRYPMDTLKVDQSFIKAIGEDLRGERVISVILGMGRALDMHAVAEGVETREQFAWLQAQGCEYGQGYLMARPLPYPKLHDALRSHFDFD